MVNNKTLTNKSGKRPSCSFNGCSTLLNAYNKSGFCSIHEKPEYQQVTNRIEELEKQLKNAVQKGQSKEAFFSKVCSSYELVELDGFRYIAEKGIEASRFSIDKEPDLFIRFIELPESEEAYLSFISKYGLLGLKRYYAGSDDGLAAAISNIRSCSVTLEDGKEPIFLIVRFHQDLKRFFGMITKQHEGEPINHLERACFERWFMELFNHDIAASLWLRPDRVDWDNYKPRLFAAIKAETLAGALVLQLYEFIRFDKPPKICALPGCENLTTRKKFCCNKHYNRFNTWRKRSSEDPNHLLRKLEELGQEYIKIFTNKEFKSLLSQWGSENLLSKDKLKQIKSVHKNGLGDKS